ncbi:hypothetical protein DDD_0407 [Nonlabens dokdonensis DSW-6]|uniref:Uncharacterized protein n=1 Tax=Nonlabens dokdonensis (strain DSM 17205 / KCTC 12402 / DSW-6) TaxID=592029 RepID=L7W5Z6_NONDD|nr:hypothetical protein DDD_0407 [Nonlabens dokdonensis DSW-6]
MPCFLEIENRFKVIIIPLSRKLTSQKSIAEVKKYRSYA